MKDSVITHVAQVVGANATAWSIALANINGMLTTLSMTLAIAYTIYKFFKDKSNNN